MIKQSIFWCLTASFYAWTPSLFSQDLGPQQLDVKDFLTWEQDSWLPEDSTSVPSLTQQSYNTVLDVHATVDISETKLVISTAGNFHRALRKIMNEVLFTSNPELKDSYFLTTSPPISIPQMSTGQVKVGNVLFTGAQPHVVMGPGGYLNNMDAEGLLSGERSQILTSYANVVLLRADDSKFKDFWDLNKNSLKFATSNPNEGGSYNNYRSSVYEIAVNHPQYQNIEPGSQQAIDDATALRNKLFDNAENTFNIGLPMHRSVPHLVASGEVDAALLFYHLAFTAIAENPGKFKIFPLGSFVDENDLSKGQTPLEGNRVGKQFVSRTITSVNAEQQAAREAFINALLSPEATAILEAEALKR